MMSQEGSVMTSMPATAVRMALEKAVASLVAHDVVTARSLAALDGQVLQINIVSPAMVFYVRFGEKPAFLGTCEQKADCELSGSAGSLVRLALADDPMAFLHQSDITLSGDNSLLIAASAIIREADIDWEQMVAQYTGGMVAHLMGSVFRQGQSTVKNIRDTFVTNLPEFLQEELRVLPPSGQIEGFREDLDELRLAADRLQARVQRLESSRRD